MLLGIILMSAILTVDGPNQEILKTKTESIRAEELPLAREIGDLLYSALQPYFPAAGLAAPQIGISKAIFIYSYDRDPKNLEVAVNPSFAPIGDKKQEGWESCFSVLLSENSWKAAKISRYETILASYWDLNGNLIEKTLEGFAAKVFQHECDHLQGIVNIDRPDAITKVFNTKSELLVFMQEVKKADAEHYKRPD